jgi:hypothetical protein
METREPTWHASKKLIQVDEQHARGTEHQSNHSRVSDEVNQHRLSAKDS